ncbi:MAG: hypothetical protein WCD28_06150 [Nitrososphaeraceae archaeon]
MSQYEISSMVFDVKNYTELRNRGVRVALLSSLSLVLIFVIYSSLTSSQDNQSLEVSTRLMNLANIVLSWTFVSIPICIYGIYLIFRAETARAYSKGSPLGSYLVITFTDIKYWRIMIISSVVYWICFAFLSQILLYEPNMSVDGNGIVTPSFIITPCCNLPGYVPMLSVYLTEFFTILIVPVNFVLSIAISIMVGFNLSLMVSFFSMSRSQNKNKKLSVVSGIGITAGLFVGCPTCAGSLISFFVGFGSGVAVSVLAPFQTLFLLISIPTLVISPFIASKFMKNSFTCNFRTSSVDAK